jgi:hypothetical protein
MQSPRPITLVLSTVLAVVGALTPAFPAQAATCTVAAAGDVAGADDYTTGAARTAALIVREDPGTVIALGDLAYRSGTADEFARYYRPTWGRFLPRTQAVAGNHEYRTPGADGMEAELGEASNDNRAITRCGWRLVLLNQYKGITKAVDYLKEQRRRYPSAPLLLAWHAPRFSSGVEHGNDTSVQPLWAAARDVHARIVLNAHDHDYERFAPMSRYGNAHPDGTRQFVSGLGGHSVRPFGTVQPHSEVRYTGQPAVLFLSLQTTGSYSWKLKRYDGAVRDSGTQAAAG